MENKNNNIIVFILIILVIYLVCQNMSQARQISGLENQLIRTQYQLKLEKENTQK